MSLSLAFDWPKYSGEILSPVFQDLSGPKDDWGILVPHEGIRHLMKLVRDCLPNFHPQNEGLKWQQKCLGDWLKNSMYPIIYYHHDLEENFFIPELRKLGAEFNDKIEHEHADLLPRLKEVTHRLTSDENTNIEAWKQDVLLLFDDLEHHMEGEERDFGPEVRKAGITEKQQKEVMEKMLGQMPFHVMKMELPIIFYAMHMWYGDSGKISKFFRDDGMPRIVFWFANWSWVGTFFDDTIDRFKSLNDMGAPYRHAGWFTCSY